MALTTANKAAHLAFPLISSQVLRTQSMARNYPPTPKLASTGLSRKVVEGSANGIADGSRISVPRSGLTSLILRFPQLREAIIAECRPHQQPHT